jgi:pilus assembly protein CpaB
MTRRRRAALLLGLALVLGALAASDVSRREAALRGQLAPLVDVVVAREPLPAGRRLTLGDLARRRIPARFAPDPRTTFVDDLVGQRLAVPVPAGGPITPLLLVRPAPPPGAAIRRGERAADVTAVAQPGAVVPGARVDVLVTRERGDGAPGAATIALEDAEVLAVGPASTADATDRGPGGSRVIATLRVTVRQAVYLAAADSFAREIRLLARAPGDHRRTGAVTVGAGL